jgi:hypothetical protein
MTHANHSRIRTEFELLLQALLQACWTALAQAERDEFRWLVFKSRGRPRNLTRAEARQLGTLIAKAAAAAPNAKR